MSSTHYAVNQCTPTKTQCTSPPPDQQAVATTPLGDEQSVVVLQLKRQRGKPTKGILIGIAIALIAVGATVCVLNITGTIKGPWSSIFAVIMASTGVIIPLTRSHTYKGELMPKITIYLGRDRN